MQKMLVVYNPYSRNKYKKKVDKIKEVISKKFEYDIYHTEGPKSITNYIKNNGEMGLFAFRKPYVTPPQFLKLFGKRKNLAVLKKKFFGTVFYLQISIVLCKS